ncbi:MAG: hypothetical protein K8F91_13300, partial [Candidatus Obscuribacterales bacterium]|nr:hypothetical protein [Candidatus Obscuribacterales bacterium]
YNGADLKSKSEAELVDTFGKAGRFFYRIVRGQDDRLVVPNRLRKSVGAEKSYAEDLKDRDEMVRGLNEIATTLLKRIEKSGGGRTITLKVKYADYQSITRSRTVVESISDFDTIMALVLDLLDSTQTGQRRVRLLGLSLSNLDSERENDEFVQLTLPISG